MSTTNATKQSPESSRELKSVKTRERILDAAASVLSQRGYRGTRLGDVAKAADLQAPAIYYYFGSREELIEEVMWTGMARLREHVQGAISKLPAEMEPIDRILAAIEAHLLFELTLSDYATAAIRNAGQLPDSVRTRQAEEESQYGLWWRGLFKEARAAGQLRPGMDDHMARMLVIGGLNWASEWWSERVGTHETLVSQTRDFVRAAIGDN